ncbi:hypothetical protein LSH36_275g01040 [Paralvinella palmiformis]|uniref:Reverse transcriptase domain-containing protein n=1 Tax=Paralvinella palmiformis TaxID=53620 RepID=A0AAD9JJ35_9ANNE|nr:hypothetical protein LSH36_275g01040 [Paralvinella palmiformis]
MLYTNADMLTNKMKELQLLTEKYCLDVVMVTEIKLKYLMDPICVSSFSMGGYQVYTNLEGEEHRWVTAKNISNTIDPLVTEVKFDTSYNEAFWRYCNSKLKNKPRIGDIKTNDDTKTQCDLVKDDILNTYFASVFIRENMEDTSSLETKYRGPPLSDVNITAELVQKRLTKLNLNKAPGPDKIHPRVLKEMADVISSHLSVIFHKSLSECRLPTLWKIGNITLIHKKGSRSTAGEVTYDPTTHSLRTVDSGDPINAVNLDFRKAFDSVPHQRLHAKIAAYGLNWTGYKLSRLIVNNV